MRFLSIAAILVIAFIGYTSFSSNKGGITMSNDKKTTTKNPEVLLTTTFGSIKIELYPEKAPKTVENFLQYVKEGHYNHTIFHRVIDGFMVQGGGFSQNLSQKTVREPIKNEANNSLLNKRGSVAMARTQEVNSATAQFFINVADNDFLNYRSSNPHEFGYCVFGQVVDGMDVVDKIKAVETGSKGPYKDLPTKPIEITIAEIVK